jgi:hypothetical protein
MHQPDNTAQHDAEQVILRFNIEGVEAVRQYGTSETWNRRRTVESTQTLAIPPTRGKSGSAFSKAAGLLVLFFIQLVLMCFLLRYKDYF